MADNPAPPRPGTAVAADDGLVVVLDTSLTDELRLEGDAREIQRAIQELRRTAGLELDDHIRLWLDMDPGLAERLGGAIERLASETLADDLRMASPPHGATAETVDVSVGRIGIGLERIS